MAHDRLRAAVNGKVGRNEQWQLFGDIGEHAVIRFPFLFSGIQVESCSRAEIPAVIFSFNVTSP